MANQHPFHPLLSDATVVDNSTSLHTERWSAPLDASRRPVYLEALEPNHMLDKGDRAADLDLNLRRHVQQARLEGR